jgi:uncharacterized protein with HEPN domain
MLTLLEAIEKIIKYSSGYKNADDFYANERDFDASMMNFIIIGEMVSRQKLLGGYELSTCLLDGSP